MRRKALAEGVPSAAVRYNILIFMESLTNQRHTAQPRRQQSVPQYRPSLLLGVDVSHRDTPTSPWPDRGPERSGRSGQIRSASQQPYPTRHQQELEDLPSRSSTYPSRFTQETAPHPTMGAHSGVRYQRRFSSLHTRGARSDMGFRSCTPIHAAHRGGVHSESGNRDEYRSARSPIVRSSHPSLDPSRYDGMAPDLYRDYQQNFEVRAPINSYFPKYGSVPPASNPAALSVYKSHQQPFIGTATQIDVRYRSTQHSHNVSPPSNAPGTQIPMYHDIHNFNPAGYYVQTRDVSNNNLPQLSNQSNLFEGLGPAPSDIHSVAAGSYGDTPPISGSPVSQTPSTYLGGSVYPATCVGGGDHQYRSDHLRFESFEPGLDQSGFQNASTSYGENVDPAAYSNIDPVAFSVDGGDEPYPSGSQNNPVHYGGNINPAAYGQGVGGSGDTTHTQVSQFASIDYNFGPADCDLQIQAAGSSYPRQRPNQSDLFEGVGSTYPAAVHGEVAHTRANQATYPQVSPVDVKDYRLDPDRYEMYRQAFSNQLEQYEGNELPNPQTYGVKTQNISDTYSQQPANQSRLGPHQSLPVQPSLTLELTLEAHSNAALPETYPATRSKSRAIAYRYFKARVQGYYASNHLQQGPGLHKNRNYHNIDQPLAVHAAYDRGVLDLKAGPDAGEFWTHDVIY